LRETSREEVSVEFYSENLKATDDFADRDRKCRIFLKLV
jgi:hypothetical protein